MYKEEVCLKGRKGGKSMSAKEVLQGKQELLYDWFGLVVLSPLEIAVVIGICLLLIYDGYNVLSLKKQDEGRYNLRLKGFKKRSVIVMVILIVGYTFFSVLNEDLREVDNYKNHPNYQKWLDNYMQPYIESQDVKEYKIMEVRYAKGNYHINVEEATEMLIVAKADIEVIDGIDRPISIKGVVLKDDFEYHYKEGQIVPVGKIQFSKGFIQEVEK